MGSLYLDMIDRLRSRLRDPLLFPENLKADLLRGFMAAGDAIKGKAASIGGDAQSLILKEWSAVSQNLGDLGETLQTCADLQLERFAGRLEDSSFREKLRNLPDSALMEPPGPPLIVGDSYPGDPVYFINGIWTTKEKALKSAEALAAHVKRPVRLIYNPSVFNPPDFVTGTPGIRGDVAEAAYDRIWPYLVLGVEPSNIAAHWGGKIQFNSTTRQMTQVLYSSERPAAIVSHSQGCIIVRNTCFALHLLGKEEKVVHGLAWVSTGSPLNENEVWPRPERYFPIVDPADPVPKLIGLQGWGDPNVTLSLPHHGFVEHYLGQTTAEMLENAPSATR